MSPFGKVVSTVAVNPHCSRLCQISSKKYESIYTARPRDTRPWGPRTLEIRGFELVPKSRKLRGFWPKAKNMTFHFIEYEGAQFGAHLFSVSYMYLKDQLYLTFTNESIWLFIKVGKSRKQIILFSILPKNEQKTSILKVSTKNTAD